MQRKSIRDLVRNPQLAPAHRMAYPAPGRRDGRSGFGCQSKWPSNQLRLRIGRGCSSTSCAPLCSPTTASTICHKLRQHPVSSLATSHSHAKAIRRITPPFAGHGSSTGDKLVDLLDNIPSRNIEYDSIPGYAPTDAELLTFSEDKCKSPAYEGANPHGVWLQRRPALIWAIKAGSPGRRIFGRYKLDDPAP